VGATGNDQRQNRNCQNIVMMKDARIYYDFEEQDRYLRGDLI
jgi:hypothetical protein